MLLVITKLDDPKDQKKPIVVNSARRWMPGEEMRYQFSLRAADIGSRPCIPIVTAYTSQTDYDRDPAAAGAR